MLNLNNSQFWIFLLVIGFGVMRWIAAKLQEQATIRAAKERVRREYEEQLRTGRTAEPYPNRRGAEAPPADELTVRRRAQLKELRRRQGDRAGSPQVNRGMASEPTVGNVRGGVPGGVVVRAPGSTGMPTGGIGGGGGVAGPRGVGGVGGVGGVVIQRIPGAGAGGGGGVVRGAGGGRGATGVRGGSPTVDRSSSPEASGARRLSLDDVRRREQAERELTARRAELQEQTKFTAERRAKAAHQAARSAASAKHEESLIRASTPIRGLALRSDDGRALPVEELRRLLILGEVLGRPVAERDLLGGAW